jgi:hypothetical protein
VAATDVVVCNGLVVRRAGQPEGVIEFAIGEDFGVTGDGRSMELQLAVAAEIDSQGVMLAVTQWVPRPFWQDVVGNAEFSGEKRKRRANTSELSGQSGPTESGF